MVSHLQKPGVRTERGSPNLPPFKFHSSVPQPSFQSGGSNQRPELALGDFRCCVSAQRFSTGLGKLDNIS